MWVPGTSAQLQMNIFYDALDGPRTAGLVRCCFCHVDMADGRIIGNGMVFDKISPVVSPLAYKFIGIRNKL